MFMNNRMLRNTQLNVFSIAMKLTKLLYVVDIQITYSFILLSR
jgi:hypothetical protein